MKNLSKYLSKLRSKSATMAGLMVFLVFTQQIHFHQNHIEVPVETTASKDAESDESRQTTMISADQDIIVSGIQLNLNHVFYEIMNIEQDEQDDTFERAGINSAPDNFRKVLFRQVISPNAP